MLSKLFDLTMISALFISVVFGNQVFAAASNQVYLDSFEDIPTLISCPSPTVTAVTGRCDVEPGDARTLIRSHLATANTLYENGELLIDEAGTIQCAACDCSGSAGYASATVLNCPEVLTTPGLINSHDHMTFQGTPADTGVERYDHRHEWRTGNGGTKINVSSTTGVEARIWGEIRHLMGGATSMIGSGSSQGLVRNLDRSLDRDGLDGPSIRIDTFPLGDSNGTLITSGCDYSDLPNPYAGSIYQAHFAAGITTAARNEWLCSAPILETTDPTLPGPSIVHGIAMTADDLPALAAARATIVWSPRSDIMLYGMTTPASMLAGGGVNLVLGTDWAPTGSMNMLRELACTAEHNSTGLDNYFSDKDMLDMATGNAAAALGIDSKVGKITAGTLADLTLFDASTRTGYSAAVRAEQEDVVLVLKAGTPMFGDGALVEALSDVAGECELMGDTIPGDCMADRRICANRETGKPYTVLVGASTGLNPVYSCGGPPTDEPTCTPARDEGDGIVYSGLPSASDSDGDGVPNATDNCPSLFNPPRPVDNFVQGDSDSDGIGDACDT